MSLINCSFKYSHTHSSSPFRLYLTNFPLISYHLLPFLLTPLGFDSNKQCVMLLWESMKYLLIWIIFKSVQELDWFYNSWFSNIFQLSNKCWEKSTYLWLLLSSSWMTNLGSCQVLIDGYLNKSNVTFNWNLSFKVSHFSSSMT